MSFSDTSSVIIETKQYKDNDGIVWRMGDVARLKRFLCLGSVNATLSPGERISFGGRGDNKVLQTMLEKGHGVRVVGEIKAYSLDGKTPNQDALLHSLAYCCRLGDRETSEAAYAIVNDVCRIPTHLFMFIGFCEELSQGSGWGRAHRRAISKWYNQFGNNPSKLAMLVTKYKSRESWTHLDVLRLCHLKPSSDGVNCIIKYLVRGLNNAVAEFETNIDEGVQRTLDYLNAIAALSKATNEDEAVGFITSHSLLREHVPTQLLNSALVWKALLTEMPVMAMVRNLGKMSTLKILDDGSDEAELVVMKLKDTELVKKARLHPVGILSAMNTYKKGAGEKGKLTWNPSVTIVDALHDALYATMKSKPTGKRFCFAVDVSNTMDKSVPNLSAVSCRDAASALLLSILQTEENCDVLAFSNRVIEQTVDKDCTLESVSELFSKIPAGSVSCCSPIEQAIRRNRDYDVFVLCTSTSWSGTGYTLMNSLKRYRHLRKIYDARVVLVSFLPCGSAMGSCNDDVGMFELSGFDASSPQIIHNFVLGKF